MVSVSEKKENLHLQVGRYRHNILQMPRAQTLQMDTFQAAPGEVSPSDLSSIRYDGNGDVVKMGEDDSTIDIEASPIEEFKRPNLH